MVCYAVKPIERVVYCFYEITMENACQREEIVLYFCDQVAYSHQNHEITRQTNHSDLKNESTNSSPDICAKTFHAKKSSRKERKRLLGEG